MRSFRFTVPAGSVYIGRLDRLTNRRIEQGDMAVDCGYGHVLLLESWERSGEQCPICLSLDAKNLSSQGQRRSSQEPQPRRRSRSIIPLIIVPPFVIVLIGTVLWLQRPSDRTPQEAHLQATLADYGPVSTARGHDTQRQVTSFPELVVSATLSQPTAAAAPADTEQYDLELTQQAQSTPMIASGNQDSVSEDTSRPSITPDSASYTRDALLPASNPLAEYSIPALRARQYDGGTIIKDERVFAVDAYDQWRISYQSDGIDVTGLMDLPHGDGSWPVLIVLHGGIDQSAYTQGHGTQIHCDYFARNGYMCLMPDYRSYNNTEGTGSPLKIPWAIDVMNLIAALPTLPEADFSRIGVLGHSRGGGIATYIMVLSAEVDAISLYAPLSTDQAINWKAYNDWFGAEWPSQDAEVYGSPQTNPDGYEAISPGSFLHLVKMPIQIHHGTGDGTLPAQWSRDLYANLEASGVEVEYFEYDGAGHSFSGSDYQNFLRRNLAFFDAYAKRSR